jgi:D-sedoheptulose 7-phosphate isomerase
MSATPSTSSTAEAIRRYLDQTAATISRADADQLAAVARALVACWQRQGAVHVLGNGGSQANAAHLVLHLRGLGMTAHDIMAESAWLSAQANDYGYRTVGATYLDAVRPEDALLVISGSGNSENVLEALKAAHARGLKRLGLLGFGGGSAAGLCDAALVLPQDAYGPVEDAHAAAIHAVAATLSEVLHRG